MFRSPDCTHLNLRGPLPAMQEDGDDRAYCPDCARRFDPDLQWVKVMRAVTSPCCEYDAGGEWSRCSHESTLLTEEGYECHDCGVVLGHSWKPRSRRDPLKGPFCWHGAGQARRAEYRQRLVEQAIRDGRIDPEAQKGEGSE